MKSDGKKLLLSFRKYSIYLYNSIIILHGNSPELEAYLYVVQICVVVIVALVIVVVEVTVVVLNVGSPGPRVVAHETSVKAP